MTNRYCVILAGGLGTRFWPISKAAKPKQFLDVADTGKHSSARHTTGSRQSFPRTTSL